MIFMGSFFDSSEGTPCQARDFGIEDETFSKQTVQIGETLDVKGSLVSLAPTQQQLKLWSVITNSDQISFSYDFFRIYLEPTNICSGKSDGNINWYFQSSPNPSEEFILKPNDVIEYSISFIPQKAGDYRIHSAIFDGDIYRMGPGQTIIVEGSGEVTDGEIFGFYLPFFSSLVLIIFGSIVGMILLKRKFCHSKIS
jgi:hypothetical protein